MRNCLHSWIPRAQSAPRLIRMVLPKRCSVHKDDLNDIVKKSLCRYDARALDCDGNVDLLYIKTMIRTVDAVETFSGKGMLSKGLRSFGRG